MDPTSGSSVPDYEPLVIHSEPRFEVLVLPNQRPRVVLKDSWNAQVGAYMTEHGITDLSLNTGMGWDGGGVGFLEEFSGLRSLAILDWRTTDLTPVLRHAATLEELIVECNPERICTLRELPALKKASLEWEAGWEGFFQGGSESLRALSVQDWPYADLAQLDSFPRLEKFVVIGSKRLRDISGLRRRSHLRELVLVDCHSITDFEAITECRELVRLDLQCKGVKDMEFASRLTRIELLSFGRNPIPTVRPLEACRELRRFRSRGKILDGDLSVFLRLPRFEWVTIEGGGRYEPTIAEINQECGHRRSG